ncbi:MAG: YbcC family protein [Planctomycetota bacterium]
MQPSSSLAKQASSNVRLDVEKVCARISPVWPLDRFVATHPFWGNTDRPMADIAAEEATLAGARVLPQRADFLTRYELGQFSDRHIDAAIRAKGWDCSVEDVLEALKRAPSAPERLPLWTDMADAATPQGCGWRWSQIALEQMSQSTAAWFDRNLGRADEETAPTLFLHGLRSISASDAAPLRAARKRVQRILSMLPEDPVQTLSEVSRALGLDAERRCTWFEALLRSIRGWASWAAHARWQARLRGADDAQIVELLAVRAVWDWLALEIDHVQAAIPAWRDRLAHHATATRIVRQSQQIEWILQRASEIAFQEQIESGLALAGHRRATSITPLAAAVFCIDVRSERYRRHLETASRGAVRTHGFAGFFGLGMSFRPLGDSESTARLPVLLAPTLDVTETSGDPRTDALLSQRRAQRRSVEGQWNRFTRGVGAAFTYVETAGILASFGLVGRSLFPKPPMRSSTATMPRFDGAGLDLAEKARLAEGFLRGAGLVHAPLPDIVMIVGHGSSSTNNAHAAGLDCGACGGHAGDLHARLMASMLGDPAVRGQLAASGLEIPATTQFVAALHDTTTDEVWLLDAQTIPITHTGAFRQVQEALTGASRATRAERAPTLGLAELCGRPDALLRALRRRAGDWSETRPEWGLAGNAAFVAAPRSRTEHLDLGGRAFLHDYHADHDPDGAILRQILTAPVVVAHWINMQYYASTVDNERFGSGNKILHDVVCGTAGVFEGYGGDLRTGLPLQSLHDGSHWQHVPLRLSVYLEASQDAIEAALATEGQVRQLVENGWLHLMQIETATGRSVQRRPDGTWAPSLGLEVPRAFG